MLSIDSPKIEFAILIIEHAEDEIFRAPLVKWFRSIVDLFAFSLVVLFLIVYEKIIPSRCGDRNRLFDAK